eukprot:scaffold49511_cov64-Phaeocystis_antarctica.AAC.1
MAVAAMNRLASQPGANAATDFRGTASASASICSPAVPFPKNDCSAGGAVVRWRRFHERLIQIGPGLRIRPTSRGNLQGRGPDRPLVQLYSTFVAMGAALLPVAEPASVACLPWYLIAPRRVEPA